MPWSEVMTRHVALRRDAMGPAALEAHVQAYTERHRARMEGLELAEQAQLDLRDELRQSLAESEPVQPTGLRRVASWFVVADAPAARPLVDVLWAHHESALQHVRALAHHAEAVERDLVLLEQDVAELAALEADAAHDASACAVHCRDLGVARIRLLGAVSRAQGDAKRDLMRELDTLEALLGRRTRDRQRFESTEARMRGLAALKRELRDVLMSAHARMVQVHSQGSQVLHDLSAHATHLRSTAGAHDMARGSTRALDDLRLVMGQAVDLADQSSEWVASHMDGLERRMRALDHEAEARQQAIQEVEDALRSTS